MNSSDLAQKIIETLPYEPNGQQTQLIGALSQFSAGDLPSNSVFLLNGYAGTGKTSIMGALVKALGEFKKKSVLLAPTGRAAKVFGKFAGYPASTIHRHIYKTEPESGYFTALKENKARPGTIFIVDEASMISGADNEFEGLNLLNDLISFVYSGDDCKLILLGDTAQLPPVGADQSPAMKPAKLKDYGLHVIRATLTATVRQAQDSGILYNATWLRRAMLMETLPAPRLCFSKFDDISGIDGTDMVDEIEKAYREVGIDETIIVTRSNKRAVQYNQAIRNQILEREEILQKGDVLMIARNNYFWTKGIKGIDFIANGEIARVEKIVSTETFGQQRFADVELSFPEHDGLILETKINLECLTAEAPALTGDQMKQIYMASLDNAERYPTGTPDSVRIQGLRTDPYYNALQVKYGYAVTCHKAQGGQWKRVFIDMGNVPEESQGLEFYRWLYTSTTRASEKIFYVNPQILSN